MDATRRVRLAKWLDLPVVLVVNGASMARSAAALVQGFERFDPAVPFAGVILNRLGSPGHLQYIREALQEHVKMPLLGGFLRDERLTLPERHLGLVTAQEHPLADDQLRLLADTTEAALDLDRLLAQLTELELDGTSPPAGQPLKPKVRIGVAQDPAFCFYYPENLMLLEQAGAELIFFSPLTDSLPKPGSASSDPFLQPGKDAHIR